MKGKTSPIAPTVYFTNWGPREGPVLGRDEPPALGVFATVEATGFPIGMAFPVGLAANRKGPVKTFRLVIGKDELEGRWMCEGRRFVRLGETAEEL